MSDRWLSLLLTQAWQLTLVILLVGILSRRITRKRPHLAVALWLIVLAKAITPPVWSSPLGVFSWTASTARPQAAKVVRAVPRPPVLSASTVLPNPEPQPVATVELPSLPDEPDTAVLPFELASPVEATPRPIDVVPLQTACWSWATVLLTIWLSGAALTLLVICSRLLHLWGTLSRAGSGPDAELAAHVETLRKRLKLRRRVRVWVTPTDHGPAVLGLIRPWLLLPKTLVESVAPDDLEPLLAHELLHIRRGDLWIGWWQAVVQAAWWLHPLVWWSNRVLTRQLERCCDEEVLAELGCEPARYARGLLKALELKHRLRPVPAAPGVRPVDLTAERMERIMRMGQGSRRRTPWWCWAIMAIGLLVTLPGAGLKLGAEEPGKVLFGVGVNSEAGVTGTVILGEDDATPADAQEPATVISGKDFELRENSLRMKSVVISAKDTEVRADSIRLKIAPESAVDEQEASGPKTTSPDEIWGRIHVEATEMVEIQSLRHLISDSNFRLGDFTQRARMLCQKLGYPFAKIELVPGHSGKPQDTTLKLHQGPRATLTGVAPDASDMERPLEFATSLPAEEPPYHTIALIEASFRDCGFFGSKVTAETVASDRRDYMIERGPRSLVQNVRFDDGIDFSATRLREFLHIGLGQPFNGQILRNRVETLRLLLRRPHSVFSTVLAIPRIDDERAVVDLIFVSHPELREVDWSRVRIPSRRPAYADITNPLHAWPQDAPVECAVGDKAYAYVGTDPSPQPHVINAADEEAGTELQQPAADAARVAATVPERIAPLDQRVTMAIKDRPLDELLAELASKYKISFVVNQLGLEEEGVRSSVPVSGEFHDVTLRAMLTLLVDEHNLVAQERDGVLLITSRGRAERLEVRTYSVADLIAPHRNEDTGRKSSEGKGKGAVTPALRSKELIELTQSTVAPDSWIVGGGKGQLQFYETTLSLVIRQTPSVHEQIAELFDQLRRRLDTHVVLQVGDRVVTAEDWKALSPDGNRQPIIGDVGGLRTARSPEVTLLNGEQASLASDLFSQPRERADSWSFDVIAVISEDRRSLTLTLLPTTYRSRFKPRSISVPDGKTLLLDISDTLAPDDPALQNGAHVVLELTPRIVVVPEEEEPLNK